MSSLRGSLIRLAFLNPELQGHILPIVTATSVSFKQTSLEPIKHGQLFSVRGFLTVPASIVPEKPVTEEPSGSWGIRNPSKEATERWMRDVAKKLDSEVDVLYTWYTKYSRAFIRKYVPDGDEVEPEFDLVNVLGLGKIIVNHPPKADGSNMVIDISFTFQYS